MQGVYGALEGAAPSPLVRDGWFRASPVGNRLPLASTLLSFSSYLIQRFIQFSSVQSLSHVQLFATPWTAAHQAFLSISNSQSLPKLKSIEPVMPSNHLILCCPLLLLPSIFPSIRVFSNVSSSHQVAKVSEFWLQHQSFQ